MTAEEVIQQIEAAFAGETYPGDDRIVERLDWESIDERAAFLGKHWRDAIDPDFLMAHRLFCFFSLEGLRFYLPAYLIGLLRFPKEGLEWSGSLLGVLYPSDRWERESRWLPRWEQLMQTFSRQQKHAVRLALEYLLATEPEIWTTNEPPANELKLELANYWGWW